MRVIFLDIDGVLNSIRYYETELGKAHIEALEYPSLEWWASGIDPAAVTRLNQLIAQTGAKVVISSTWRYGAPEGWLQKVLEARGFEGEVIGATPHFPELSRKYEISAWLNEHKPEAYVVLDDDADAEIQGRFVRTGHHFGLLDKDVEEAKRILEQPWQS